MIEKFAPRNRPDDDAFAAQAKLSDADHSFEEIAKEHLALRFDWARAVAQSQGRDMADVLSECTDLYARVFGVRIEQQDVEADTQWQAFVAQLKEGADPVELAYRIRESRKLAGIGNEVVDREFFGPFRYDYHPETKEIDIHFGSMGWSDDERDAPQQFNADTRNALADMFRTIKSRHPDAKKVAGGSWLFTRLLSSKLYKSKMYEVLPRKFIDSGNEEENQGQGGGLWGQFIDNRGRLHAKRAAEFRKRMHDPEIMEKGPYRRAFPIQATYLSAPIEVFYKEYGIE